MLTYNTTYWVPAQHVGHFLIWIHETLLPQVAADGALSSPRLLKAVGVGSDEEACYSLQFAVPDMATLHRWYLRQGRGLTDELVRLFDGQVMGNATVLEEVQWA